MTGRIFITGATGFVGTAVCAEAVQRGFFIHRLSRTGESTATHEASASEPLAQQTQKEIPFRGDINDAASLDAAMAGCDGVIHLVGIIMEQRSKGVTFERIHVEGTQNVLAAAKRAGVRRYIHMSALGSRANAVSQYHKTKWQAEEAVRASGLDWTIFRPSMIHGPGGEFMQMAAKWASKTAMPYLFMPYFGRGLLGLGGAGLVQPVYVNDVARAFADALQKPETIRQTYDLVGPDRMDWPTMHKTIARAVVGKSRLTAPIPAWYAKAIAAVLPAKLLPFNRDQVVMSQEDNTADVKTVVNAFGWSPAGFEASLNSYALQLR
ncbi:MAG TPA: complex I NDUFA9 subunit family protein [Tepidisphaeraceae bacterium]|nr:complex I NDUFA9 subunit family protein [Tepidisphaeraceae bacterium]